MTNHTQPSQQMSEVALPDLPPDDLHCVNERGLFTAGQMREYAERAVREAMEKRAEHPVLPSQQVPVEQPWSDHRIKLNGVYIGCVTKGNADQIVAALLAQSAPAAIDVRDAALPTAEEFAANNNMAVTKDWMMGWNACRSSIAMPTSNVRPWGYHRYGSGPEKGYTITYADRLHNNEEIAYIGDGEIAREAVTAICNAHNTSLQSPPQTGKESQA